MPRSNNNSSNRSRNNRNSRSSSNRNRRSNNNRHAQGIQVPESFKACEDGWKMDDHSESPFKLMTEEEFEDEYLKNILKDAFVKIATDVSDAVKSHGGDPSNPVDAFELLLSNVALIKIVNFTNEELSRRNFDRTSDVEYRRFLAHKGLASRFRMPLELVWSDFMVGLASAHHFELMELQRFKQLLQCTRGFSSRGRNGANPDSEWLESNHTLRQISDVETEIFKPSMDCLLNKTNGAVVVDDELVSSRANDVELKMLSDRKSGKEGPVADCIADSMSGMLFGMRLRVKRESQQQNVEQLLQTLPRLSSTEHKMVMCFDRGYGKADFIRSVCSRNINILTIASTLGSRHPFITAAEHEALLAKWDKAKSPETLRQAAASKFEKSGRSVQFVKSLYVQ